MENSVGSNDHSRRHSAHAAAAVARAAGGLHVQRTRVITVFVDSGDRAAVHTQLRAIEVSQEAATLSDGYKSMRSQAKSVFGNGSANVMRPHHPRIGRRLSCPHSDGLIHAGGAPTEGASIGHRYDGPAARCTARSHLGAIPVRLTGVIRCEEVARQEGDAARFSQLNKAGEHLLAREPLETVVHADHLGGDAETRCDFRAGKTRLQEAVDSFHAPSA